MAKFIETVNNYRVYELDYQECKQHYRSYPTFITWKYAEDIGNMWVSENETSNIEEMKEWCKNN